MEKPVIEIKNITKTYKTGSVVYNALKGITFSVGKSELVAIMGPSGSGKSTLMHILGILDTPDTGEYILNGINISSMNKNKLAEIRNREIGFIFQSFNLLPRATVFDNVEVPLIYRGIKKNSRIKLVENALNQVQIAEKALNKPNQISGGQTQRVAIARAIAGDPSIILADEPTGNLDSKTSIQIMRIFQEMNNKGKTILLITHEPDIADYCKRIITLKDGVITGDFNNSHKFINLLEDEIK